FVQANSQRPTLTVKQTFELACRRFFRNSAVKVDGLPAIWNGKHQPAMRQFNCRGFCHRWRAPLSLSCLKENVSSVREPHDAYSMTKQVTGLPVPARIGIDCQGDSGLGDGDREEKTKCKNERAAHDYPQLVCRNASVQSL